MCHVPKHGSFLIISAFHIQVFLSMVVLSSFQPCLRAEKPHLPVVQKLPPLLKCLHNPAYNRMTPDELINECKSVFDSKVIVTGEKASYLEQCTRLQSQSLIWHQHRTGRITASRFYAVVHTPIVSVHHHNLLLRTEILRTLSVAAQITCYSVGNTK